MPETPHFPRYARILLAGGLGGAVLLAVSQFLPLFHTGVEGHRGPIDTVTVGSAHAYGLLPVALLAAVLAYGVWSTLSRPALVASALLGVLSLLISLIRDLPYAERSGIKLFHGHYLLAANSVAAGLYVETLGAMLLLLAGVSGLILLGRPRGQRRREPSGAGDSSVAGRFAS